MKTRHPPLILPIKGGKVPSPLAGEGLGEGYFRTNTISLSCPFVLCSRKLVEGATEQRDLVGCLTRTDLKNTTGKVNNNRKSRRDTNHPPLW